MIILVTIILGLLTFYIFLNIAYLLIFSVAGLFRKIPEYFPVSPKRKFAVLIPAYKEDKIIINTIRSALAQDYGKENYDIIVIADKLKAETLTKLSEFPIKICQVSYEKSTKAKAIKSAILSLPSDYYHVVMILDADNFLGKGCLEKINSAFERGFDMVQLHRTAKNKNTPTAVLDALSEEMNNHIFRKGHRSFGISSALIGSGMAFDYTLFRKLVLEANMDNNPGEDREIYLEMLKRGKICEYIDNGLVFDEKVQSNQVLEKQRTRWISAQMQYAKKFWVKEFVRTLSSDIHYLDNAVQTLLLPRVLLFGIVFILWIGSIILFMVTGLSSTLLISTALIICCFIVFICSVWKILAIKDILKLIRFIPGTLFSVLIAFFKSRSNQKEFIHTPKEFVNQ